MQIGPEGERTGGGERRESPSASVGFIAVVVLVRWRSGGVRRGRGRLVTQLFLAAVSAQLGLTLKGDRSAKASLLVRWTVYQNAGELAA